MTQIGKTIRSLEQVSMLEKELAMLRYAADYMLHCLHNPAFELTDAQYERLQAYARVYSECNAIAQSALLTLERKHGRRCLQ